MMRVKRARSEKVNQSAIESGNVLLASSDRSARFSSPDHRETFEILSTSEIYCSSPYSQTAEKSDHRAVNYASQNYCAAKGT